MAAHLDLTIPMIRVVVETLSTPHDRNGNSYHAVRLTDTVTGERLGPYEIGAPSNAQIIMRELGLSFGRYLQIETTITPRQWKGLRIPYAGGEADMAKAFREKVAARVCPEGNLCQNLNCRELGYRQGQPYHAGYPKVLK